MTRERRVCKNLLLVGSNHYALSADHSITKTHYQSKHSLQKNLLGKLPMAAPPLAIVVLDRLQPFKQW